jgi:plastocyanin
VRIPVTFAAAALAAAVGLCAGAAQAAKPRTAVIVIDQLAFGPSPAGLRVGDRVRWTNRDIFRHSATADDHSFDVDLQPRSQGETVLRHAGVIAYSCRFHPGMKGRLVVKP